MSPTLYLSIDDFEYEGKTLLWVYVPPTSTVEKCANKIYDRNEDGDMDITDSPIQLQNLYKRKSDTYTERRIFPYVTKDDLRMDLMDKVRNLAKSKNANHSWLEMSDDEIMKSAGLWEKDFSSGLQGFNLAGILLLGKDEVIQSCCPGYITDAICRVENTDRYDDMQTVKTNLIDAYDILMEFVEKHTSDKFYLINNVNTSVRGIISREVIGNILVHRDYSSAYPAKVIIEKDWLKTENWCIPRRHGNIMSDEFQPYPKNPVLQRFFANIGRTDTIGSGVKNLYKYTPIYSDGGKPELFEDDVFKITIPLNKEAAKTAKEQNSLSDRQQAIYNMICDNRHLTVEQVMAEFDISRATVFREYGKIKKITGALYDKASSTWTL
jgi:ATP-dependent DNA helicase RecG